MLGSEALSALPLSSLGEPTISGGGTTLNLQVGASGEDSHQQSIPSDAGRNPTGSGTCSLTAAILSPGSHSAGDEWSIAAAFVLNVAQGETVSEAVFSLRANATYNAGSNVIKLYASVQDADAPAALSASSADLNAAARPRTTATTVLDVTSVTGGVWYEWDITPAVQELVNRAAWAYGNRCIVLIDTHEDTTLNEWQDFDAYDGSAAGAPKLDVTFGTGGGPSTSPISGISFGGSIAYGVISGRANAGGVDASGSFETGAIRARGALAGRDASGSVEYGAARGRVAASGVDVSASIAYGRVSAAGRISGRDAGASIAIGLIMARGALAGRDAGGSIAFGLLVIAGSTAFIFGRDVSYSFAVGTPSARGALRGIGAGLSLAFGRPGAVGGLRGIGGGNSVGLADPSARGALAGRDAGSSIGYGLPTAPIVSPVEILVMLTLLRRERGLTVSERAMGLSLSQRDDHHTLPDRDMGLNVWPRSRNLTVDQ